MVRPRVFLDIAIGAQPAGRITIELFNDHTPSTCENFRLLCTGEKGQVTTPTGTHDLCFKNSTFHRIISEFMIQGGDITTGDGTGGASTFPNNASFPDENLGWRKIDAPGLVCMANRGIGTNNSQFFITLAECEYLTQKHTLFGHVVSGMDVVRRLEAVPVDSFDHPVDPVIIANCGELIFKKKAAVPSPPKSTTIEARRERPRSRDRKKDDERRSHHHHHRRRSDRSRSKPRSGSKSRSGKDTPTTDTKEADGRGRSRERQGVEATDVILEEPEETPKRAPERSRSRSKQRHRRRRHHSGSRSPERRRRRRERERDYTRDEEAEERIKREEEAREGGRFARMDEERGGGEPEVKFKGRGSMKYREKKSWGWSGGEGRLV